MSAIHTLLEYSRAPVINGVIEGVKIVGNRSKKGRDYPQDVLVRAIPLYERAPVHLLHGTSRERKRGQRKLLAHFGHVENVREMPGKGGLFGDLHIKQSHGLSGTIVESDGTEFGLSHQARCAMNDDATEVTEILGVDSVDLVDNPATTRNLFEGDDQMDIAELAAAQEASDEKIAELAAGQGKILTALEGLAKPANKGRITALEQVGDDGDGDDGDHPPLYELGHEAFARGLQGINTGGINA